jgi:hypothetical protein
LTLHEEIVQDAVADFAQRFPPCDLSDESAGFTDIMSYLRGQGFPPAVAAEAAVRHMPANNP